MSASVAARELASAIAEREDVVRRLRAAELRASQNAQCVVEAAQLRAELDTVRGDLAVAVERAAEAQVLRARSEVAERALAKERRVLDVLRRLLPASAVSVAEAAASAGGGDDALLAAPALRAFSELTMPELGPSDASVVAALARLQREHAVVVAEAGELRAGLSIAQGRVASAAADVRRLEAERKALEDSCAAEAQRARSLARELALAVRERDDLRTLADTFRDVVQLAHTSGAAATALEVLT